MFIQYIEPYMYILSESLIFNIFSEPDMLLEASNCTTRQLHSLTTVQIKPLRVLVIWALMKVINTK